MCARQTKAQNLLFVFVGSRTGGEPREIAGVCSPQFREPEMAGTGRRNGGPKHGPITDEPEKTPATQ